MMYAPLRDNPEIILCQITETITLGENTGEQDAQHAAQLNPPPSSAHPAVAKLRKQERRRVAKGERTKIFCEVLSAAFSRTVSYYCLCGGQVLWSLRLTKSFQLLLKIQCDKYINETTECSQRDCKHHFKFNLIWTRSSRKSDLHCTTKCQQCHDIYV